jgi:hypothetical protein
METPFNVGNRTVSTNSYCLLSTPLQDGFEDRSERVKKVYPIEHNMIKVIITASEPSMWYKGKTGERFEVVNNTNLIYYELPNSNKIIFKCDAKQVF